MVRASNHEGTIVFFHGDANSLKSAAPIADPYITDGYGFLLADYRAYSGLPGKPTEPVSTTMRHYSVPDDRGNRQQTLYSVRAFNGDRRCRANGNQVGGLMLAPYLSILKLAQIDFPFFPFRYFALVEGQNEAGAHHDGSAQPGQGPGLSQAG
jgi:uncharacterized protein